jgi:hypothetical protein
MPRIEIDVPATLATQLDKKLGAGASALVAQAAFLEWANWLLAASRPISLSELDVARVHTLYNDILREEMPTASQLSARLQLPIARCRYIIQSLGYQYPSLVRRRLLGALQKAYKAIAQNGDVHIMDVHPECGEMLEEMLGQIADSAGLADLRGKKHGGLIRYELTSGYYRHLGNAIDAALAAEKGG